MLIAFPVSLREREQAKRLFLWIEETGAGRNHDALLVLGKPAAAARFDSEIRPLMERCFKSVTVFEIPIECGPEWNPKTSPDASGANNMFLWGSIYCDDTLHRRFFWNEMDAVPTRSSAYDEIEREDAEAGKPFMGARENTTPPRLSGIAMYPTEMPSHSVLIRNAATVAWDIAAAGEIMPRAHITTNIQNVHWLGGECKAAAQWDGKAAIFHQCKCGCIYDRLRAAEKPTLTVRSIAITSPNDEPAAASNSTQKTLKEMGALESLPSRRGLGMSASESIRFHCTELASIVGDKRGRKGQLHHELRKAGLLGKAKARK